MTPNLTLQADKIDNLAAFRDPFFARFQLRERGIPLQLNDSIRKDYLFPTCYADVTCAQAIFLCDYDKAAAQLPHPAMKPVRMPGNRALLIVASYIYRNVMHIAPYNEIALTIPVMIDPTINVPVLPVLMGGFRKFGYYVFNMPVTSLENRIRGNQIWGLPKTVHSISIEQTQNSCRTQATDDQGNDWFEMTLPTQGRTSHFDTQANLYSRLNNELLQSTTYFKGDFAIQKRLGKLFKTHDTTPRADAELRLGEGPYADQIRALNVDPQAFQTRFAARMNACFDLPNANYQAPFRFSANHTPANHTTGAPQHG